MKFSTHWLNDFVATDLHVQQLNEQLTMAGLEVEGIAPVAPPFSEVCIGLVEDLKPHPNADSLQICTVNIGKAESLSIVCGAKNVAPGIKVPVALVGAKLPNGLKIKEATIRGSKSFGMICSKQELGLAEQSEGIWILAPSAPIGESLRTYLDLDDFILELSITPNRADCQSVLGVAREVAALNKLAFRAPQIKPIRAQIDEVLPIKIENQSDCQRYLGRVIRGVNTAAPAPSWLTERLNRSGVRSISAVVDVTNYVLLELGQPLHAFDLAQLTGEIQVRRAHAGERLQLLDGKEVCMDEQVLVIADQKAAQAMAGIMGGDASAVKVGITQDIYLESAFFNPTAIAGRARRFGLSTDASQLFERGVDPQITALALERATELILEIAGGEAGPIHGVGLEYIAPTQLIELPANKIERMLGCELPASVCQDILQNLGLRLIKDQGKLTIWEVPSYRFDLKIAEDLVEELARVYGYSKLPSRRPIRDLLMPAVSAEQFSPASLRSLMADLGYHEVINYSFVDPNWQQYFFAPEQALKLKNPMSSEMAVMRQSLLPGLVKTAQYNLQHQMSSLRLFEIGNCFSQQFEEGAEYFAALLTGARFPEQWGVDNKTIADFYDLKGSLETVLRIVVGDSYQFKPAKHPALHPGKTAEIWSKDQLLGIIGQLHPMLADQLEFVDPVLLFECKLLPFMKRNLADFKKLSKFPYIRRDIALVLDAEIKVSELINLAKQSAGKLLEDVAIFDVYQGTGIQQGKKSIALSLVLQHQDRTLTDQEANQIIEQVIDAMESRLGAKLRK